MYLSHSSWLSCYSSLLCLGYSDKRQENPESIRQQDWEDSRESLNLPCSWCSRYSELPTLKPGQRYRLSPWYSLSLLWAVLLSNVTCSSLSWKISRIKFFTFLVCFRSTSALSSSNWVQILHSHSLYNQLCPEVTCSIWPQLLVRAKCARQRSNLGRPLF